MGKRARSHASSVGLRKVADGDGPEEGYKTAKDCGITINVDDKRRKLVVETTSNKFLQAWAWKREHLCVHLTAHAPLALILLHLSS